MRHLPARTDNRGRVHDDAAAVGRVRGSPPFAVEVDTFDALAAEARVFVNAAEGQVVRLFYACFNEGGVPRSAQDRVPLVETAQFESVVRDGDSVVWVSVGSASPTSNPQKRKPQSPFIRPGHNDVTFEILPELFEDTALATMTEALRARRADPHLVLMLAIPGSGKTRTVAESTHALSYRCARVHIILGASSDSDPIEKCIKEAAAEGKLLSYAEWKLRFGSVFEKIFKEHLDGLGAGSGERVLHVDDVQTLMRGTVVSRKKTWDPATGDPHDIVLAAACGVLHRLMYNDSRLRCVVTGTNFFAPLALNTGADAKVLFVAIDGTFPPEWVLNCLVHKYFDVPVDLHDAVREHVTFLCGNRALCSIFWSSSSPCWQGSARATR